MKSGKESPKERDQGLQIQTVNMRNSETDPRKRTASTPGQTQGDRLASSHMALVVRVTQPPLDLPHVLTERAAGASFST